MVAMIHLWPTQAFRIDLDVSRAVRMNAVIAISKVRRMIKRMMEDEAKEYVHGG